MPQHRAAAATAGAPGRARRPRAAPGAPRACDRGSVRCCCGRRAAGRAASRSGSPAAERRGMADQDVPGPPLASGGPRAAGWRRPGAKPRARARARAGARAPSAAAVRAARPQRGRAVAAHAAPSRGRATGGGGARRCSWWAPTRSRRLRSPAMGGRSWTASCAAVARPTLRRVPQAPRARQRPAGWARARPGGRRARRGPAARWRARWRRRARRWRRGWWRPACGAWGCGARRSPHARKRRAAGVKAPRPNVCMKHHCVYETACDLGQVAPAPRRQAREAMPCHGGEAWRCGRGTQALLQV